MNDDFFLSYHYALRHIEANYFASEYISRMAIGSLVELKYM